ncbi:MAG: RNA polymerase sigma factor RpoE [Candidatus Tectimicrobiota bacterium]|nr:MAG: RNA polymerase sigma factor RpoE [Candidatus Tectomicrobia bacterium]
MAEAAAWKSKQEAFAAVALAHSSALYHTALRLTRDPDAAQDLVQETYLRAYRFFHRFQPGTQAKAWLITILRHAYINAWRQAVRRPAQVDFAAVEPVYAAPDSAPERPGRLEAQLDHLLQDEVKQALASLPEPYRQVVVLADLEDYAYKEIAARLDCPIGTVMSRLFRARRRLRRQLEAFARAAGYLQSPPQDTARPPAAPA